MKIDVPDHAATDVSILLATMGYYMISDTGSIPTPVFLLADIFNQLMEDKDGKGDYFEAIAQKFDDVADIIRNDPKAQAMSSFKAWV